MPHNNPQEAVTKQQTSHLDSNNLKNDSLLFCNSLFFIVIKIIFCLRKKQKWKLFVENNCNMVKNSVKF